MIYIEVSSCYRWFRVSVTLSGSVMVVHIDCKEVLRRVIAVPDYCVNSNNIVASVGATMYQTEFSMGLTVSETGGRE